MAYLLLNENKTVDALPIRPDVFKVEKRVRGSPYTEYYFRWYGHELQRVSIYDRYGERRVVDFTKAAKLGKTPAELCRAFNIPPEWCVADYKP